MTRDLSKAADFRALLQEELLERCKKNPRYSLRSFAQSLKVGSSDLSKIIHGKRGLSDEMIVRLGTRLDLDPKAIEKYRATAKDKGPKRKGASASGDFATLSLDAFRVVSDWYPLAIVEMAKVRGFDPSPKAIAKALGLTVNEVTIAIERLVRLGMLEVTEDGKFVDLAGSTTAVTPDYTDAAKRKYQKQILEKAMAAIDNVPITQRDQSSMLMAVDSAKLDEARVLIKDFRRQLCRLLESGNNKDQVMFLSVSLFPVLGEMP